LACPNESLWALLVPRCADFAVSAVPELSLRVEVTEPSLDEASSPRAGPFARIDGQNDVLTIEGAGFHGAFDESTRERRALLRRHAPGSPDPRGVPGPGPGAPHPARPPLWARWGAVPTVLHGVRGRGRGGQAPGRGPSRARAGPLEPRRGASPPAGGDAAPRGRGPRSPSTPSTGLGAWRFTWTRPGPRLSTGTSS